MSEENAKVIEEVTPDTKVELTLEEANAKIAKLESINTDVIESRDSAKTKLKDLEDAADKKKTKNLKEQNKYKDLYEASEKKISGLQDQFKSQAINTALKDALNDIGTVSMSTALKLVDTSEIEYADGVVDADSVKLVVETLKSDHAVLFGKKVVKTPDVKRPGQKEHEGGYLEELASTTNQNEYNAVRAKFGK